MSRSVSTQKTDALATEVYEGPTIRKLPTPLDLTKLKTTSGKPVTFDQMALAMENAKNAVVKRK